MFFPWCQTMGHDPQSSKKYQEQRLSCLRWVKDSLETRLAAVSAAIESIEAQQRRDAESNS